MRIPHAAIRYTTLASFAILSLLFLAVPGSFAAEKHINASSAATSPTVVGNYLVDQDKNLPFSQNKQNEPAITRDPITGVLIAGANDEIGQPLCSGTTTPLASPCPFGPGVPTSAYYHSNDNGKTWSGGYLPGFDTIGRISGGDPSLDYGPRLCANGTFSFSCGATIYYGSLADPFPEFGGEQVTVSRSHDDGLTWANPVAATSTDNKSNFDDHDWIAVDHVPGSPHFGRVYVFWCDFSGGHGVVKGAVSSDGVNWTQLGTIASVTGRNAFFPAASVAPNGTVSLTFDALTQPPANDPWQTGVQVYDNYYAELPAGGLAFSAPIRVSTASSNPDGSGYNNLQEQFIGDYIDIVAGPRNAYLVWTDARNATVCQAVDAYRNAVYAGSKTAVAPNPDSACTTSFGNTDTEAAIVNY